jgi:hypothetical protein
MSAANARNGGIMGQLGKIKFALAVGAIAVLGASAGGLQTVDAAAVLAGNVDYVNGGVTQDEADQLRADAKSYPLEVVLAQQRGDEGNAFVSNALLRITDESGREVVSVMDAGPIFLARLPDGRYTVEAVHEGKAKRQQVTIKGGRHQKVGFLW